MSEVRDDGARSGDDSEERVGGGHDRAVVDSGTTEAEELPMSEAEFGELGKLESDISDCWWGMGLAFGEIKAKKLYRQTPDGERQTWEDYCKIKHKKTKQYVDRLIRAAGVTTTLKTETIVSALPATPSQASELVGLAPDEMAVAVGAALSTAKAEDRKATAKDYRNAAQAAKKKRPSPPQDTANDPLPGSGETTSGLPGSPAHGEQVALESSPVAVPQKAKRYSIKITVQAPEDRQAVSDVLRELDVPFVTNQYPTMTKLVGSPLASSLGRLLTRIGLWFEENAPASFAIQVGEKRG